MINLTGMVSIPFIKKSRFTGSYEGMRYALEKGEHILEPATEEAPAKTAPTLVAIIWPEPYAYDATPEEQKYRKEFPFHPDGIPEAVAWLNEEYQAGHFKKR